MRTWAVLAATLAGLLLLSGALIILGRHSGEANPSATSYEPSGTLAFRQLLGQGGYRTAVTSSVLPRLRPNDLLVVFDYSKSDDDRILSSFPGQQENERNAIKDHLNEGGRVIIFPVAKNFARDSKLAAKITVSPGSEAEEPHIAVSEGSSEDPDQTAPAYLGQYASGAILWTAGGDPFASAYRFGKGRLVVLRDGLFATNRFLDKAENARFALGLVRGLAQSPSTVVFDEAYFGEPVQPGLLESIGPWAEAMWFQGIFLFVVVVFTLGKRFGLPDLIPAKQRGTRELLDAVAGTLRRGKMASVTLNLAASDAESRLRKTLQVPADMSQKEVLDQLPVTLQRALVDVRSAATMRTRPDQAKNLVSRLDSEVIAFEGGHRRRL